MWWEGGSKEVGSSGKAVMISKSKGVVFAVCPEIEPGPRRLRLWFP